VPRTGLNAEQIKERAVHLAETKLRVLGIARIRLTDVAREMGIAHSALYKHFPDKAALFDAVSEKWTRTVSNKLDRIAQQNQSPSKLIVDLFVTLHRMKVERITRDPELYKAFELAASGPPKAFSIEFVKRLHDQLLTLVKKAIAKKEFAPGSAEKYAAFLIEVTRGFITPKLVIHFAKQDREPELKSTLKLALKALSK
jgi:AcrR family transcriptional regulator